MIKKIIISDIDGTLIGNDRKIPPEMEQLATLIQTQEVPFTIASGRIQSRIEELVKVLGITLPVIGCNGASAKQGDHYIWNKLIPPDCLKEAVLLADHLGMSVVMTDGEKEYAYRRTPWVANLMDNYGRYDGVRQPTEKEWQTERIQKVLIDDSAKSGKIDTVIELLQQFPDYITVVRYQSGTVDVLPANCSKGEAIKKLAEYLGVNMADIVAVGDHQNDLEMIVSAGTGAAVANASEELKQAADYVCKNELCAGVIEVVERVIKDDETI